MTFILLQLRQNQGGRIKLNSIFIFFNSVTPFPSPFVLYISRNLITFLIGFRSVGIWNSILIFNVEVTITSTHTWCFPPSGRMRAWRVFVREREPAAHTELGENGRWEHKQSNTFPVSHRTEIAFLYKLCHR